MDTIILDDYLVPGTSSTYYIPEFVTEDEEEYLIRKVRLTSIFFPSCPEQLPTYFWYATDPRSTPTMVETPQQPQVSGTWLRPSVNTRSGMADSIMHG